MSAPALALDAPLFGKAASHNGHCSRMYRLSPYFLVGFACAMILGWAGAWHHLSSEEPTINMAIRLPLLSSVAGRFRPSFRPQPVQSSPSASMHLRATATAEKIEAPKKPKNAYQLFMDEKRPGLKDQVPVGEKTLMWVQKQGSELWKGLDDKARAPYDEKAAALKDEYNKLTGGSKSSKSKEKDSSKPKAPKNAYMLWLDENRASLTSQVPEGESKISWVAKKGGELWKAMSEADKAPFTEKAATLKKAYQELVPPKSKKAGKADDGKPKKPVGGAYSIWLKANRPEIVNSLPEGHKVTDVAKAAGEQWKALSDADKGPWEEKYKQAVAQYETDMAAYKVAQPA